MHHSAAVVQKSIAAAIQNTPGSRPCVARDGGGASIASRRSLHHADTGTEKRGQQRDSPARVQRRGPTTTSVRHGVHEVDQPSVVACRYLDSCR
jgi:hypothetical protein